MVQIPLVHSLFFCANMNGQVVICGGGIIGASIAYHLTLMGVEPIVVEQCSIAAAASGKAGGFLARAKDLAWRMPLNF